MKKFLTNIVVIAMLSVSTSSFAYNVNKEGDFETEKANMIEAIDGKMSEHAGVRYVLRKLNRMKKCVLQTETLKEIDDCRWGKKK